MSENVECPYCGYSISIDGRTLSYDQKTGIRCPNCGGRFEYMEGFGAFSIPGEGQRMQPRTSYDGSYPDDSGFPLDSESYPRQQGGGGTCCAVCICFLLLISFMFSLFLLFGTIWF